MSRLDHLQEGCGHATQSATKSGLVAYCELIVDPLRYEQGAIIGGNCAATKITPHRRATEVLGFQSTVPKLISDAVIVVDLIERVLYRYRGVEQVFGYNAEEMLGQPPDRLIPPEERRLFPQRFETVRCNYRVRRTSLATGERQRSIVRPVGGFTERNRQDVARYGQADVAALTGYFVTFCIPLVMTSIPLQSGPSWKVLSCPIWKASIIYIPHFPICHSLDPRTM